MADFFSALSSQFAQRGATAGGLGNILLGAPAMMKAQDQAEQADAKRREFQSAFQQALTANNGDAAAAIAQVIQTPAGAALWESKDTQEALKIVTEVLKPAEAAKPDWQAAVDTTTGKPLTINMADPKTQDAVATGRYTLAEKQQLPGVARSPELQQQMLDAAAAGRAPGTTVNVGGAPVTPLSEAAAKAEGPMLADVTKGRVNADNLLSQVQRGEAILDETKARGGKPGLFTPTKADVTRFLQSVGAPKDFLETVGLDPDLVGPVQVGNSFFNQLALSFIGAGADRPEGGGMPGNLFSEADRQFVVSIPGTMSDDEEGLRTRLEVMRRLAERLRAGSEDWWKNYRSNIGKPGGFATLEEAWTAFQIDAFDKYESVNMFDDLFQSVQGKMGGLAANEVITDPDTGQQFLFLGGDTSDLTRYIPMARRAGGQ